MDKRRFDYWGACRKFGTCYIHTVAYERLHKQHEKPPLFPYICLQHFCSMQVKLKMDVVLCQLSDANQISCSSLSEEKTAWQQRVSYNDNQQVK